MRKTAIRAGRSINLAISERGLSALRQVDLEDEAKRHAIAMRGRVLHPVKGDLGFQAYGKDDSQCIHSISRGWLNQMLMTAAEATGRVEIQFEQRLLSATGPGRRELQAGSTIQPERGRLRHAAHSRC